MAHYLPWTKSHCVSNERVRAPSYVREHASRMSRLKRGNRRARFPKFQELPSELRVAIWKFALLGEPRVIRPRFVGGGESNIGDLIMASVSAPKPNILRACREANAISPKTWVDPDILFFSTYDCRRFNYIPPPEPFVPVLAMLLHPLSAYQTHQIALECASVEMAFIRFMVHCQKLTRVFLVIACERSTQRVLDMVWPGAAQFHENYSAIAGSSRPPPEVVILLKRRNYDFRRGVESVYSEDFFSNFTVVPYKPGHRAQIGSHGVLSRYCLSKGSSGSRAMLFQSN